MAKNNKPGDPIMFKFNVSLTFIVVLLMLIVSSGCVNIFKGEYYLGAEQYEKGIHAFEQEIIKKPDDAKNHYYLGRFLLAQKKYIKANTHLKRAVNLQPGNDKYHFWLGISYGGLENDQLEMENYRKTIQLNSRHFQAHTYLGHSLFRSKKYLSALKSYNKALSIKSNNPSALYNSALILSRLKRNTEAKTAFKKYLNNYNNIPKSIKAVSYLNKMGDFEYRIHLFNRSKLVLKKISFDPLKLELEKDSRISLQTIGFMAKRNPKVILYILAYQKNNKALARKKAAAIKTYLLDMFPGIKSKQIKLSWFDTPERIRIGKQHHTLDASINLFAIVEKSVK